jgi:hypothetical protein
MFGGFALNLTFLKAHATRFFCNAKFSGSDVREGVENGSFFR